MSSIIAASAILYVAGFLFFESDQKRTMIFSGARLPGGLLTLRLGAYALLATALMLLANHVGIVRAIPVWIGLLMVFGVASLAIASWQKSAHKAAGLTATCLGISSLAVLGTGALRW